MLGWLHPQSISPQCMPKTTSTGRTHQQLLRHMTTIASLASQGHEPHVHVLVAWQCANGTCTKPQRLLACQTHPNPNRNCSPTQFKSLSSSPTDPLSRGVLDTINHRPSCLCTHTCTNTHHTRGLAHQPTPHAPTPLLLPPASCLHGMLCVGVCGGQPHTPTMLPKPAARTPC